MRSIENEGDLIDAEIRRIGFNLEAQFTAHLQHHGIFPENLAGYLRQAFGFSVFDDHLHQRPPQSAAFQIRSQQDRILAVITRRTAVNPDNAQDIAAGFIERHKRHRAREIELGQPGKERMAELLDRIEKAKPQIFLAAVLQQIKDQRLVGGANRPDENLLAVAEDEMPFPLRG